LDRNASSIPGPYYNIAPFSIQTLSIILFNTVHIMLRECLTQIRWTSKWLPFLDTLEHVDSKNINLKIGHGSYLYILFSKRDFYFIKCGWNWQKMSKNGFFRFFWKSLIFDYICCKNVRDVFHDPEKRENSPKKFKKRSI
jgi:hypothetical protein